METDSTIIKKQIHLSEPWFSLVKLGIKTIEGRLNKHHLSVGDKIKFFNDDFDIGRECKVIITSIKKYDTFSWYLTNNLHACLPGIDTVEEGLKVYYTYYSKEDELKYKVISIDFTLIKSKPEPKINLIQSLRDLELAVVIYNKGSSISKFLKRFQNESDEEILNELRKDAKEIIKHLDENEIEDECSYQNSYLEKKIRRDNLTSLVQLCNNILQ